MSFNFETFLKTEENKEYFKTIKEILNLKNLCPKKENIFNAFKNFNFETLKVIIIGQDPYPNIEDAHGLAFSSLNKKTPASLKNIFKVIKQDYKDVDFKTNNLENWKNQGVLLLNMILSTEIGFSLKHKNKGWETFNINLLNKLNTEYSNIIYVILGNQAKKFVSKLINLNNQIILETSHPSPLSCNKGFLDSRIFYLVNEELKKLNKEIIKWDTF
ncbi:uracil-DNA glycosylase [Mycoplasma struthionis]|uniref:Uracil-DNA glycosylase n=1 Tax=Mycoplasma struthionis TaxID=538220 RepID=A0A3G8LFU1_9MOLU|nr:uracil-DNA glycosylase [Mycoplasma struthionis]AZG68499.1 uracil-DNA glycosylase [Mycoplasma struthionis]